MKKLFVILFAIVSFSIVKAQVSINLTGNAPRPSAGLDVDFSNLGILIPRVALTQTTSALPITSPDSSLLVYNTATINDVKPGYYYWNGSRWTRLLAGSTPSDAWLTSGNAGTTAGTHFIGTTDSVDFVFKTQNTEKMRITSTGRVGIGTTTPGYRLDLNGGTFAFGNGNVRTETRNNAGLQGSAGAQSGFFETFSPINYPTGATSWWHLIDVRHSNNFNNYAMQFAGSFFDQKLYFRKTNNNPAQPWTEVLTGNYLNANIITVESTSSLGLTGTAFTAIPGESITVNGLNPGDRVLVWFEGNMYMSGSDYNDVDVALFINGSMATVGGVVRVSLDNFNGMITWQNYSAIAQYTVTTAGNYIFDVRARELMAGNIIYIGGNSSEPSEGVLIVFVLKN